MIINGDKLLNVPILSLQAGGAVAWTKEAIIDPDKLKVVGFWLGGPNIDRRGPNILDANSVREFSKYGMVIDSEGEFVSKGDVIKLDKIIDLPFRLIGIKVESQKGAKIGKVLSFTCTHDTFEIQQLIVQRPAMKSFLDPELMVPRSEIVEVTDKKIIVKHDAKTIKERATNEDFVPNFVNPFRKNSEQDYVPTQNQTLDGQDN